jgi:hypothetical protein
VQLGPVVCFCLSSMEKEVTTTLSASESISALVESASVVLLKFILSSNVAPPSLDALNFTSSFWHYLPFKL